MYYKYSYFHKHTARLFARGLDYQPVLSGKRLSGETVCERDAKVLEVFTKKLKRIHGLFIY